MQEGAKLNRCPQFRSVLIEQFHCAIYSTIEMSVCCGNTHCMKLLRQKAAENPMRKCDVYSTLKPNWSLSMGVIRLNSTAYNCPDTYPQPIRNAYYTCSVKGSGT